MDCASCRRSLNVNGRRCTRCKAEFYCNKDCQVASWNLKHKRECVNEISE